MKQVCIEKRTFLLLALVLRQFWLSVARSGSNPLRASGFFVCNFESYTLLREKLSNIIEKNSLDIDWNQEIEEQRPSGLRNLLTKRTCFYELDFRHIVRIYFCGYELLKSDKIEQNEKWMFLGREAQMFSQYLIDSKLSPKERKIVNLVEHFEQNDMVSDKFYSIEEALALLLVGYYT